MNASEKFRFSSIPVIITALVTILLWTIARAPTSDPVTWFVAWLVLSGITCIPMGFILAFGVQMVRCKNVEYSLFRAVTLGFVVGAVSIGLVAVAMSGVLLRWFYSFV